MTTTPDFRALCAELTEYLALLDEPPHELVVRSHTALATPPPEPPTDEKEYFPNLWSAFKGMLKELF